MSKNLTIPTPANLAKIKGEIRAWNARLYEPVESWESDPDIGDLVPWNLLVPHLTPATCPCKVDGYCRLTGLEDQRDGLYWREHLADVFSRHGETISGLDYYPASRIHRATARRWAKQLSPSQVAWQAGELDYLPEWDDVI